MTSRALISVVIVIAWVSFAAAIIWPAIALLGLCLVEGRAPADGFGFSARQLGLLWRSVWLSGVATIGCVALSLPAALALARFDGLRRRSVLVGWLVAAVLCPPMVYVFGWGKILPNWTDGRLQCIAVWMLWAWPIPAVLIGAGWSRVGRRAFEAALCVSSPPAAMLRVGLPAVSRYLALSAMVVFVLFFGDYGVPHASGLLVFSTELLGWTQESRYAIDIVWPAVLPLIVTGGTLGVLVLSWRRCAVDGSFDRRGVGPGRATSLSMILVLMLLLTSVVPLGGLIAKVGTLEIFVRAIQTYGADIAWSLGVAALAGVASTLMGLGVVAWTRARGVALVAALLLGTLPGALVGESLVAAYNHGPTASLYDNWTILLVAYVARFGWIGVLAAMLVVRESSPSLIGQARTDGASGSQILARVQFMGQVPTLLCSVAAITALSVADVAASTLVRVPSYSPVAHVLIEKFHRFEDGMLISLSLLLVLVTIPGAVIAAIAVRSRW